MPVTKVIHLTRKPVQTASSVAANALRWGTGALNIDAGRLSGGGPKQATAGRRTVLWGVGKGGCSYEKGTGAVWSHEGRWPANLLLEHLPGCRKMGQRNVEGTPQDSMTPTTHEAPAKFGYSPERHQFNYAGEVVDTWECVPGCPVADLDGQTGVLASGSGTVKRSSGSDTQGNQGASYGAESRPSGTPQIWYGDAGGASRFFKQVRTMQQDSQPPQELIDYLVTLISPPGQPALYWDALEPHLDWLSHQGDDTLPGLILRGAPTVEESEEILRALKPGAHLLLIAPDEQPTGHTGACNIEDAGFEVRDALLWVREAGRLHYVPKASRSEREAGCDHLPAKTGTEVVGREEGTVGRNSAAVGAGRTASEIRNHHPTVKPIDLMAALLQDMPVDQGPILDPFMGSGTTGCSCLRTGHSFIGMDNKPEYVHISDARIRFWERDGARAWGEPAVIHSEDGFKPEEAETEPDADMEMWGGDPTLLGYDD